MPLASMRVLQDEGFFSFVSDGGHRVETFRDLYGQVMGLGYEDLSLALCASMDRAARALYLDDTVPLEQRMRIAGIMDSKILATFVSGVNTRSEAGIASFNSDVSARPVEIDGKKYRQIWSKKGVATNAEGCDWAAVSVKDAGDDSEFGGRFVFVEMRDAEGNLADGITIHDTGHTLGVPSTRSCSVSFDGVLVPEELALPWSKNLLGHFLVGNASASFGVYTSAYIGAAKRVLAYMESKKSSTKRVRDRISGCHDTVLVAEKALMEAAHMKDEGASLELVAGQLLLAKSFIGRAISDDLFPVASYVSGFHDLAFDNTSNEGLPVFVAGLWMANGQPPSSPMIEDIFDGRITLPSL